MARWYAFPRVNLHPRSFAALLAAGLGLTACDEGAPPREPLAPPEVALRDADVRGSVPEDARVADVRIEASLDADEHVIDGTLELTWRNRTNRTVSSMPFHLYVNGFRADDTAWMNDARGRFRGDKLGEDGWGYMDISGVRQVGRGKVADVETGALDPTKLEWKELADPSLMEVELQEPVGPGESVKLEIDFVTKMPRVFARTGYYEDFHMAGQWFPKVGVLEEAAGWKAHTFTMWSEFYADFGNYEVVLDLPATMKVGATGIQVDRQEEGDRQLLTYRAEMVHDFAWVADPNFIESWTEQDGIWVHQLFPPDEEGTLDELADVQGWTLESMQQRFGPYPWSTVTQVLPPKGAEGAGGMEYPTFYTIGRRESTPPFLDERVTGYFVTVHEFGHQYFQGLVASNEHDQPWMDEGLNTFANILAYQDEYGEDSYVAKLFGHEIPIADFLRLQLGAALPLDPIDQPASAFPGQSPSYFQVSYGKAAAVLYTLRELVGHESFDAAMRGFVDEYRFRHPTGKQFEEFMIAGLGRSVRLVGDGGPGTVDLDVQDYFDQTLRTPFEADFTLIRANSRRKVREAGFYRHEHDGESKLHKHAPDGSHVDLDESPEDGDDGDYSDEQAEAVVTVMRRGTLRVPVELLVEFTDLSRELFLWDGRERYVTYTFPGKRLRRATLDPAHKLIFEAKRLDNTLYAPKVKHDKGVSNDVARMTEGLSLALMGGLVP